MKCVLHIGTEKTATTLIQHWLYSNQIELSRQRIAISNFLIKYNNRDLSAFFNSAIDDFFESKNVTTLGEKELYFKDFLDGFVKEIRLLSNDHDYMVITSEHFHSRLTNVNDIKVLRDFLFTYFDDVKVVCYFREQSDMRESLYSTALRCGYTCSLIDFQLLISVNSHYYNYLIMFSKWDSIFGFAKLEPIIYDKNFWYEGDIRKDFIKRVFCGVDLDSLNYSIERANEKVSYLQALFIRAINTAFSTGRSLILIRNRLVSEVLFNESLAIGNLVDSRKIHFYKQFDESNKLFFKKFFGKSENFFKKPISQDRINNLFSIEIENALIDGITGILKQIPLLFDDEANQLKNIALKYESCLLLTKDDALALMKLAKRVHPNDTLINAKLSEWEK